MRKRLNRFTDVLLPLGLAVLLLFSQNSPQYLPGVLAWAVSAPITLGVTAAFGRAAAMETNTDRLRGLWTCAVTVLLLLAALFAGAYRCGAIYMLFDAMGIVRHTQTAVQIFFTALLMQAAFLNTEWLRIHNDHFSDALSSVLITAILLGGICINTALPAAAAAAVISFVLAWGTQGLPFGKPCLRLLRQLPFAFAAATLYPLLSLACLKLIPFSSLVYVPACLLAGFALIAACRTTFRRSESETPFMAVPVLFCTAACVAAAAFLPGGHIYYAVFCVCAALCCCLFYSAPVWNVIVCMLLLCASIPLGAFFPNLRYIPAAAAFLSLLPLLPLLRSLMMPLRARRLRRKARAAALARSRKA